MQISCIEHDQDDDTNTNSQQGLQCTDKSNTMTKDCVANEGTHRINMRLFRDAADYENKLKSQFKKVSPISRRDHFKMITTMSITMPTMLATATVMRPRTNYYYVVINLMMHPWMNHLTQLIKCLSFWYFSRCLLFFNNISHRRMIIIIYISIPQISLFFILRSIL